MTAGFFPLGWWRWRRGSSDSRVLTLTGEHFAETGEWPKVDEVQSGLVACLDLSDAERKVGRLPRSLGRKKNGRVVLSVSGLHRGDPTSFLLGDFEKTLVVVSRHYREKVRRREKPMIALSGLAKELSISGLRAELAVQLLVTEGLASQGSGNGTVAITSKIVPFLYVRNVDEYMRERRTVECRSFRRRIRSLPSSLIRWFKSDDTSIGAKIAVAVLTTVAVMLVTTLLMLGIRAVQSGDENHTSLKSAAARSGG